jgi:hypothetical protein
MKASCIRDAQTFQPFGAFAVSDPNPTACENIGKQSEGLEAASKLISNYFTALNDLASFGTSKATDATKSSGDAKSLAATASSQAKLSEGREKALASVADFLAHAAMSGYQQKQLADDIVKVHEDVKAVLDGLGEAAGVAYLHQLEDEEQKTADRYTEFLRGVEKQRQPTADVILALDSRWQADRASFAAKQKAAKSYKAALATMAKGNEDLAAHARSLKEKDLSGLLSPYAAQLETLAPAIQKAF